MTVHWNIQGNLQVILDVKLNSVADLKSLRNMMIIMAELVLMLFWSKMPWTWNRIRWICSRNLIAFSIPCNSVLEIAVEMVIDLLDIIYFPCLIVLRKYLCGGFADIFLRIAWNFYLQSADHVALLNDISRGPSKGA